MGLVGPPVSGHTRGKKRVGRAEAAGWTPAVRVVFNPEPSAQPTALDDEGALLGVRGIRLERHSCSASRPQRREEERGRREGVNGSPWVMPTTSVARSSGGARQSAARMTAMDKVTVAPREVWQGWSHVGDGGNGVYAPRCRPWRVGDVGRGRRLTGETGGTCERSARGNISGRLRGRKG